MNFTFYETKFKLNCTRNVISRTLLC